MRYRGAFFFSGILSAVLWFAHGAAAQSEHEPNRCNDLFVKSVGEHLRLSDFSYPAAGRYPSAENGGLIASGVCKVLPTNSSRIVGAFAYDAGGEDEKELLLALADASSNRIIASFKGAIPVDPAHEVNEYSLRLDTARYTLSKNTRAFGLRLNTFRERCGYDGGIDDQLTLFIIDGKVLRPVFSENMTHWVYGGGNRCGGEVVPRIDASVFISVENTSSNGFADLRLSVRSNARTKPPSVVVKYTGETYDLSLWKKAFSTWWGAIDPDAR